MNLAKRVCKFLIRCWAFIFLGLALIISDCARTYEMSGAIPKAHLWDRLCGPDEEVPGYAVYTYVLVNRSKADVETWNKYQELVASIKWSTSQEDEQILLMDRSLYNIFLIPEDCGENPDGGSLNDVLSKSILTGIAATVQEQGLRERINTNPGPFLISAADPISNENIQREIEMLYVDLSRTNLDAMPEVVAAYKTRLTSESIDGIERFKSIRLSLLNLILDSDDFISIVKVAYAGWIKE